MNKEITRCIKIILLWIYLLLPTALLAQTQSVSGRLVIDETDGKTNGLPYASVVIINALDSAFVKGSTTDANGYFSINYPTKQANNYLLKASYLGYAPDFRPLNPKEVHIKTGTIKLKEADIELGEVVVTAKLRELEQVGDTTVINANVYKTPQGSYLEDLVKRIPGLEYDSKEETLTYNGLTIEEINVNGESFLGDDIVMALENLPAEVIDKIKVYNKKTELEKATGVSTGEDNYVLDLQTKKEFNGTLNTSTKAGYGNNRKKDLELQGNYFKNGGDNLSVFARSGNRNMRTRYKDNRQDNAVTNFTKKVGKDLTFSGHASYNRDKSGNENTSYNEQYLTTGNKYNYSAGESAGTSRRFNSMLGTRWKINEKTFFNISGNFSLTRGDNTNVNRQATFSANPGLDITDPFNDKFNTVTDDIRINDISKHTLSGNDQYRYAFNAGITRKLNEKGTNISLTGQYEDAKRENENFTISSTTYYLLENAAGNDSVLYRNQYRFSPNRNHRSGLGVMLTHPFTKQTRLQLSYNLNYSKQQDNANTYDLSGFMKEAAEFPGYLPPDYESGYTDSLSNRSRSRTLTQDITLRMNYSTDMWNIITGVTVSPERRSIDQKTGLLKADTTTNTVGFRPMSMLTWKKGKSLVRLSYQGNTRQPSLSSLLSLTDNSDPLNIRRGNPDLKPTYSQNIRFEAQNTDKGLFATLNWNNEINSQTQATTYNLLTGGRETYPVNINGNWSTNGTLRYQKRIKEFRISTRGGATYRESVSLINEGKSETPDRSKTHNTSLNHDLQLSYQPKWGGFDLRGDWRFQHSSNSLRQTDNYTRNYSVGFDGYVDLPGDIEIQTDASYSFRNGTNIKKGEDDQVVWNAGISWRFLKKKQLELSAYWNDILSQKKNFSRSTTASGFYEQHSQQIGSYFIFSIRYRLNKAL